MPWIVLLFAGLLEVAWAYGLKQSEGFSKPVPTAVTLVCMAGSVALLGVALRHLPVGTAYVVWTGIGAVGTAILGMVMLREPADLAKIVCLGLIVAGIVGLKLFAKT